MRKAQKLIVHWRDGHKMIIWKYQGYGSWCGFMVDEDGQRIRHTFVDDMSCHHNLCTRIVNKFELLYS